MTRGEKIGSAIAILLAAAMISVMIVSIIRGDEKTNVCISGGYARTLKYAETDLCLGVIDGEWQIEPLADVRERLESQ